MQRLLNNYQKTTSIEMSLIAKIVDKKTFLQNKNNNKISISSITKFRTFKFCRYCDDDYYDNVCFIQTKIIIIEVKKKTRSLTQLNLTNSI